MKDVKKYAYLGIPGQLDVNVPYSVDGKCIYPFGEEVEIPTHTYVSKKDKSPLRESSTVETNTKAFIDNEDTKKLRKVINCLDSIVKAKYEPKFNALEL
jgi:hypothetical protein